MTLPMTPPTGRYTTLTTLTDNTYEVMQHPNLKDARAYLTEEMKWESTLSCSISDGAWTVAIEHSDDHLRIPYVTRINHECFCVEVDDPRHDGRTA